MMPIGNSLELNKIKEYSNALSFVLKRKEKNKYIIIEDESVKYTEDKTSQSITSTIKYLADFVLKNSSNNQNNEQTHVKYLANKLIKYIYEKCDANNMPDINFLALEQVATFIDKPEIVKTRYGIGKEQTKTIRNPVTNKIEKITIKPTISYTQYLSEILREKNQEKLKKNQFKILKESPYEITYQEFSKAFRVEFEKSINQLFESMSSELENSKNKLKPIEVELKRKSIKEQHQKLEAFSGFVSDCFNDLLNILREEIDSKRLTVREALKTYGEKFERYLMEKHEVNQSVDRETFKTLMGAVVFDGDNILPAAEILITLKQEIKDMIEQNIQFLKEQKKSHLLQEGRIKLLILDFSELHANIDHYQINDIIDKLQRYNQDTLLKDQTQTLQKFPILQLIKAYEDWTWRDDQEKSLNYKIFDQTTQRQLKQILTPVMSNIDFILDLNELMSK